MSRLDRVRVGLDGLLSESRPDSVRGIVFSRLIGSAGDLAVLNNLRDPKGAVREVAALGRLAYWLDMGEMYVPDRIARELMSHIAAEVAHENEVEEIVGRHEEGVAEHEALAAFASIFSERSPQDGGER